MRRKPEFDCKALDAMLRNLDLILQAKGRRCGEMRIWQLCRGWTPETERKDNQQSYELSSICRSREVFCLLNETALTWVLCHSALLVRKSVPVGWVYRADRGGEDWDPSQAQGQADDKSDDRCLHGTSHMPGCDKGPYCRGRLIPNPRAVGLCPSSAQPVSGGSLQPTDAGLRWKQGYLP